MTTQNTMGQYGIAYTWLLAPHGVRDFDLSLVSVGYDGESGQSLTRTFHLELPDKGARAGVQDISGILGLLWGGTDEDAQHKAQAFERALSDILLWHLDRMPHVDDPSQRIILVQGPMIPKLRGRLQYRMPDTRVLVCTLTYQRDWLRRLEMSSVDTDRVLAAVPREAEMVIGEIFPPKGVDTGSRTWLAMKDGQPYHVEAITCTQVGRQSEWVESIERRIKTILQDDELEAVTTGQDGTVLLPKALSKATKLCNELAEAEGNWQEIHSVLSWNHCYKETKSQACAVLKRLGDIPELWSSPAKVDRVFALAADEDRLRDEKGVRDALLRMPDQLRKFVADIRKRRERVT